MENNLFEKVTELTGLPAELIQDDLRRFLERHEICVETLTIEELRQIMVEYLSETVDMTLAC